jgi:hypothetical protein
LKKAKTIFIWVGVIALLLVGAYYLILPRIIGNILSAGPRNPRLEIPVTYEIGWGRSHQDAMQIDSFSVEFVESRLNLFNNKSLIKYTVKGKLSGKKHWKPSIQNVHMSQRFTREYNHDLHPYLDSDTASIPEAIIEITPVIDFTEDPNYAGEVIEFEFTNELLLESFHWGNSWVRFQCKDHWKDLILEQRK